MKETDLLSRFACFNEFFTVSAVIFAFYDILGVNNFN